MKMMKIETTGKCYPVEANGLKDYQKEVGGLIEIVNARVGSRKLFLIVNDEGAINGMPFNPVASLVYGFLEHGQPILGDGILCKRVATEDGYDCGGFDDAEIDEIMRDIEAEIDGI